MSFKESAKLYYTIFWKITVDYEADNKKLNLTPSELSLKKKLRCFSIFQIFYFFLVHIGLDLFNFNSHPFILRFLIWSLIIPFFHLLFRKDDLKPLLSKMKRN